MVQVTIIAVDVGDDLGGGDRLANVPLRMVGDMYKKTADCRREFFFANFSWIFKLRRAECAKVAPGFARADTEFIEPAPASGGLGVEFRFHCCDLDGIQRIAFRIGEQAIRAARDVSNMKCYGGDSGRPRIRYSASMKIAR